ncbi:hypothetical protein [Mycobacterium sp.]|uniref:hypothetical protein n=1 Tax=Mycobacterium sp. TaxID=1785 RepID=UPI003F96F451
MDAATEAWKLNSREARSLHSAIESALAHGWRAADLTNHLIRNPNGARDPVRVLARRLTPACQGELSPLVHCKSA